MSNLYRDYKKSIRVIESCENKTHLEGARNYVNNFFKIHSLPIVEEYVNVDPKLFDSPPTFEIRKPDLIAAHLYEELFIAWENKSEDLGESY